MKKFPVWPLAVVGVAMIAVSQKAFHPLAAPDFLITLDRVGPDANAGQKRLVTPDNQVLTPAGKQVELPRMRPQAAALSPDGKILAVSGKTSEVVILDPASGEIRQRVTLPHEQDVTPKPVSDNILRPDKSGQLSFTGLRFSPDGRRLFLSNVNGSIKVFTVAPDGTVAPSFTIALPPANAPERRAEIPAGLTVSPDGSKLYVALNLGNRVGEFEAATGSLIRMWDVGVAPFDVALSGKELLVSNWGGRRPDSTVPTGHAGRGTRVRIDPRTGASCEGSVSIIDLSAGEQGAVIREVVTGRHASALALSPDGRHAVVACAAGDVLEVIDLTTDDVCERISPKQTPADLFGAAPNALAFAPDGETLYVCNGSQNAVAVVEFMPGKSELEGLIPTGWYPGAVVVDSGRQQLCVANIKGIGNARQKANVAPAPAEGTGPAQGINTHQYFGTVSLIPLPKSRQELKDLTSQVLSNYRAPLLSSAFTPPQPWRQRVPVPLRVGEPSVFRHVVYIIKENRTYDQVLGDMPEGDGDPSLCLFGENVTPNQHRISREFALLDNTYCSGILSADGHNWSCSAITTDYLERQFAGFPRSYPDGCSTAEADALAWSPAGFIWDAALARGRSVRLFGEFAESQRAWKVPGDRGKPRWTEIMADLRRHGTGSGSEISLKVIPSMENVAKLLDPDFPAYDNDVPDIWRAEIFIRRLREWEKSDTMPHLVVMSLPGDHTSATRPGAATPRAHVADNDLAFGRMVEAISRSRFWRDTCIIAIEDDPQNGWDHVSGYRTTAYVASAWSRGRGTIRTQYNQTSVLRTIGLILGLPPMNQLDATATPMFDCFGSEPDFRPYVAEAPRWPLEELNPTTSQIDDPELRRNAEVSLTLPLEKMDACPEDVLNRILWTAVRGSGEAYPEWAVGVAGDDDD